jgi:hypothetical protein
VIMLMIILQAVRLDQTQPWFQAIKRKAKPEPKKGILTRERS